MQVIHQLAEPGANVPRVPPALRDDVRAEEVLAKPLIRMLGSTGADENLREHSWEVGELAARIGRRLHLPEVTLRRLRLAGVLHDVGKAFVPQSILDKPGPLSSLEWAQIRRHPETGYLLARSAGLGEIAGWIRAHHERPDGRGYPFGVKSRPLEAAIIAVADTFHAMTAERPYQQAVSPAVACQEIEVCAGTQFEPRVVDALIGPTTAGPLALLSPCPSRPTRT